MDIRTGRTYGTREQARADGVPESDLAEILPAAVPSDAPEVRFTSGPFKTRVYKRTDDGHLVRVR